MKKTPLFNRRNFLQSAAASIGVMEWLGYFRRHGVPGTPGDWDIAATRAAQDGGVGGQDETRFLIYWFLEGGVDSYAMFTPVDTLNNSAIDVPANTLDPTGLGFPSWTNQFYRVKNFGTGEYSLAATQNAIRHGYLARPGQDLFPDMAVIASHHGSTFHSGGRFDYHYGKYNRELSAPRESDERSVMQAFAEAKGASFLLPHISWHRWLADGELALPNYPEGTGYYEKLGPAYAHTIYGNTPDEFRKRLSTLGDIASTQRKGILRGYTDNLHNRFMRDRDGPTVRAFSSALDIYKSLSRGGLTLDPHALFTDAAQLAEFNIQPGDAETSEASVNMNPARGKQSPHIRMQSLMTYECMRNLLGCAFWLESRDVRQFDSHRSRREVLRQDGNSDQLNLMKDQLWNPLRILVNKLKATEMPNMPGTSMWHQTTIVVASEMGRSMMGDVDTILTGTGTVDEKYTAIIEQDVCQHWPVSAAAFLGGRVAGGQGFGRVGTQTLDSIPVDLATGALDPAFDPVTGVLRSGMAQSAGTRVTNSGHVYATALKLAGVDPAGKGRNVEAPLNFILAP